MRHNLNDRFMLRAISTMFVALVVMLGSVMPAATSSRTGPAVDDGGAGGTRATVVDAPTQNEFSTMLTESREAQAPVVVSDEMRQILLIEGLQPKSAFVEAGDAASAYCYRCYSYR